MATYQDIYTLISSNNIQGLTDLLQNDFDPNTPIPNDTYLNLAIRSRKPEIAELFIRYGAIINMDSIMLSIRNGDVELTDTLIRNSSGFDIFADRSSQALNAAVQTGNLNMIKLLVSYGADFRRKDREGKTPFYRAVENREPKYEIIYYFLTIGSFVDETADDGVCVLSLSLRNSKFEISRLLIEAGAEVSVSDYDDRTPLMYANAVYAPDAIIEALIRPESINAQDDRGATSLMHAVMRGNKNCLILLLRNGADITIRDLRGMSALDHASVSKRDGRGYIIKPDQEIIKLLKDADRGVM